MTKEFKAGTLRVEVGYEQQDDITFITIKLDDEQELTISQFEYIDLTKIFNSNEFKKEVRGF